MKLRTVIMLLLGAFVVGCGGRHIAPTSGAVASADRSLIRYQVAGSGNTTLLFIHCWSCDASYWSAQVAHFADDHLVVAMDLAGHGASGAQRRNWTVQAFAEDVRAVADGLDLTNVVLVGSSMGGVVALEAAALMPERVRAIVGVDAFHDFTLLPDEQAAAFLAPFRDDFPAATQRFVRDLLVGPDADPEVVERVAVDMASAPPAVAVPAMENLLAYGPDQVRDARQRAPVPVAAINGVIVPTDSAALRAALGDVRIDVMEATGHFPMLERPEAFNGLLEDVLRDLFRRR